MIEPKFPVALAHRTGQGIATSLLLLIASSCGESGPRPLPVSGVITMDGKAEWPVGGDLYFDPVSSAEGFPKRGGHAEFDKNGRFAVTTFKDSDGLYPGTYRVQANCWKVRPMPQAQTGESYLPAKYRDPTTSGFEVVVEVGTPRDDVQLDVKTAE